MHSFCIFITAFRILTMKLIKPLTCALALALSGQAFASITITVPAEVSILAANGEKVRLTGDFFDDVKTFTLPDGENQFVFRYSPYFNQGKDRVNAESDVIVTRFNAANTQITFELPKYRDLKDAKKHIKDLDWKLINTTGQAIPMKQDKLLKPGMQIGRDYLRELESYNKTAGVASIGLGKAQMQPVTLPAKLPSGMTADSTAEEMLHFWYQKADTETQARFKDFVNKQ